MEGRGQVEEVDEEGGSVKTLHLQVDRSILEDRKRDERSAGM